MSALNKESTVREISVVIPNFNGRNLLEKNLPSVIEALQNVPGHHEIIIPDDASTDDSVAFIKQHYPQIIIVENRKNKGFSPNINSGIFKATKELVFALNSDVWLSAHYFDTLLQYFDDDNTFGVMGKIIDLEGEKIQDGAKYPQKKGFQIKSTLNFLLKDIEPGFKVPTFFLSGANALMDRHKLFQIMAYNEIYAPFYVEDVDLSLKAWRMGWKCYFDEKAICRHPVSVTIGKHNRKNFIKTTSIRNQMILQELHLDGFELVGWRLQLLFNVLTKWITLNTRFYNAFFQLISKWNLVQKSKAEFNTLLNNHGKSKRISQVISEIKNSIAQYPIQYF